MDHELNSATLVNITRPNMENIAAPLTSIVIKTILCIILMIFSSLGNTLVIIIVYRDQTLRSNVDIFIVNMAVSDLLIPIFSTPKQISELYMGSRWVIDGHVGSFLCKFFPFAENIANMVSVLTLVIIAVERFYSVVLPVHKPLITKTNRLCLVAVSWIVPIAAFTHLIFSWKVQKYRHEKHCRYSWSLKAWKVEFYVFFSLVIALPVFLLTVLYSTVIISLEKRKRTLHLADEQRKRREKRNRKIVFLLVLLVVVFVLSWTPYSIFIFLYLYQPALILHSGHYQGMHFASLFFSLAFTAINPCLYYVFNNNYRRGFHRCLSFVQSLCVRCGAIKKEETALDPNQPAVGVEMARQRASTVRFTGMNEKSNQKDLLPF